MPKTRLSAEQIVMLLRPIENVDGSRKFDQTACREPDIWNNYATTTVKSSTA